MNWKFWENRNQNTQQTWKPHWSLTTVYKVWMAVFTAIKIALGAVATVLLIGVACAFAFLGVLGDYLEKDILPNAGLVLENYDMEETSYLYYVDSDGEIKQLQQIYADTVSKRASFEDIPENLIHAAVAIEDKRFYEHQGVDWFTTIKAVANMFFGDQTVGGSSITQQLIKNVTGEDSVTVQRKVLEFFQAVHVEKRYDKDTIMEAYLNYIYLGQGCRGVKSAAATYFGKEMEFLTLAECASLISITNNPSLFDPYNDDVFTYAGEEMNGMQRNKYRQELVLKEMLSQGWITEEEYTEAVAQELVLKNGIDDGDVLVKCREECGYVGTVATLEQKNDGYYCPQCQQELSVQVNSSQDVYSWFVEAALEEVAMDLAAQENMEWSDSVAEMYMDLISRSGYHIYTTLNMDVQNQIDKIYQDLNEIPDTYSGQQLESGIVIVDNATGDIVGLAGGVGEKTVFDAHSVATDARLQSGSSIKPLSIYAPGFELGILSPATVVKDLPYFYDGSGSPWPRNDNRVYNYSRSIYSAIVSSVNAVAVNSLEKIGTSYSFNFAKEKFGLSTLVDKYVDTDGTVMTDVGYSPLAMGAQTQGVTIRDMAVAYATFANNGVYRNSRLYTVIYNSDGEEVYRNPQPSEQILSTKAVNYTNYCLTNAVNYGTGSRAAISGMNVAGKTGSTSSFRDRWFCGFTKYYSAAVWCGYRMPEVINPVGGNYNVAAELWRKVMAPLHKGKADAKLYDSSKMVSVSVCLDSGLLATSACSADIRGLDRVDSVLVYTEDIPGRYCDKHVKVEYCETGKGVANEFCKKLAEAGAGVTLKETVLVKLTLSEFREIKDASRFGLNGAYAKDSYVYLVDGNGNDADFKGFGNNANQNVSAPYIVCTAHTAKEWEEYQANSVKPTDPATPPPEATVPNEQPSDGNQTAGASNE